MRVLCRCLVEKCDQPEFDILHTLKQVSMDMICGEYCSRCICKIQSYLNLHTKFSFLVYENMLRSKFLNISKCLPQKMHFVRENLQILHDKKKSMGRVNKKE